MLCLRRALGGHTSVVRDPGTRASLAPLSSFTLGSCGCAPTEGVWPGFLPSPGPSWASVAAVGPCYPGHRSLGLGWGQSLVPRWVPCGWGCWPFSFLCFAGWVGGNERNCSFSIAWAAQHVILHGGPLRRPGPSPATPGPVCLEASSSAGCGQS